MAEGGGWEGSGGGIGGKFRRSAGRGMDAVVRDAGFSAGCNCMVLFVVDFRSRGRIRAVSVPRWTLSSSVAE